MNEPWQPYREPFRVTLARNGAIAVAVGGVAAALAGGGVRQWPAAALLALWPAFGGHWVEVLFLNRLRPGLPAARGPQAVARVAFWFAAGCALAAGVCATAAVLPGVNPPRRLTWWGGGAAFVGIELVAHLVLHLRGRDSFYNGRG